ncbi:MAG: hypothetical protein AB1349_10740 [Elusimicrobiota bacterium]
MLNQVEYYKDSAVRNRISEFIRGAEYIVGYGEAETWQGNPNGYYSAPPSHLNVMLDRGLDIFRSMLGSFGTMLTLDIEYYNSKYPGEIYLNANSIFTNKIQPIREIVQSVYTEFGIPFLEVITGQGYHYHTIWPFQCEHWQIEKIGKLEYTLEQQYRYRQSRHNFPTIPPYKGLGYSGAFRLLQFVTLEIVSRVGLSRKNNKNILPIQFCDIAMHPPEGISLDLTIYSDPIHMRDIRAPFSTHQKHKVKRQEIGEHVSQQVPVQITFPTSDLTVNQLIEMRRHFQLAAQYAADTKSNCIIPDGSSGWLNVLVKYKSSKLYEFHKKFDAVHHEREENWYRTYYAVNLNELPPCVRYCLLFPEPHLKKPTNIRTLVAVLRKKGWGYKHIAGFLYSRFKGLSDFSPNRYNAETRANFFVQLYGAPIYLGLDKLTDLNCISYQEKGYCVQHWCGYNLAWWR